MEGFAGLHAWHGSLAHQLAADEGFDLGLVVDVEIDASGLGAGEGDGRPQRPQRGQPCSNGAGHAPVAWSSLQVHQYPCVGPWRVHPTRQIAWMSRSTSCPLGMKSYG